MKTIWGIVGVSGLVGVLIGGSIFTAHTQTLAAATKQLSVVPPQNLPYNGTYWLVTRDGGFLIPFPGLPDLAENTPVFSLGSPGQFLVDATGGVAPQPNWRQAQRGVTAASLLDQQSKAVLDLITQVQAAYAAEQAAAAKKLATTGLLSLSAVGPPMPGDGTGDTNVIIPDDLGLNLSGFGSNDLWLQIFMTNRALARLLINTPDTNGIYDVYATSNLNLLVPGLNLTNWTQLTRTAFNQTNVLVTNLWADMGFFRLGTMLDSDSDGLPDAFELLVSHTNPNLRDTNGNGILDGDELSPTGLPWRLEQVRRSAAVVYASAPTAAEGGACGLFTVYLPSPAPAGGLTVQYRLGGTAVLNTDYTVSPAANSLFIPANTTSASILVCASNNTTYSDLDRYAEITLTNATVGVVDSSPARVDIVDNDPPALRVFALPNWVREPSSTYGTNAAAFYFVRDGEATNSVTLNFSFGGSTAVANVNYAALPTAVTFPANVRTNLLTVVPLVDTNTATDRVLTLTLTTATGYQMDATANAATLTIANVSTPQTAVVQVTATDDDAREAGLNPGVFTFTRTGATADALRVYYHTTGTAKSGSTNLVRDYIELPGYVDLAPGAVSTNVTVTPVDNALSQVMRTVIVVLAGGDYSIGTNHQATVYIDDNDGTSYSPLVVREGVYGSQFRQPAMVQVTRYGSALTSAKLHFVLTYGFLGNTNTSQGASGDVLGADIIWSNRQTVATAKFDPNWQNLPTTTLNASLNLSNAVTQIPLNLPFHLPKDLISVNSSVSPATTVIEGNTVSGALVFHRPYPDANAQTLTYTATGSAGAGTDYTVGATVIGGSASQLSVSVQAINNAAAQWRTAVISVTATPSQVPQEGADHAFIRIQDPVVTDPLQDSDLDGDGISDGVELSHAAQGYDPLTWNNAYADDDRDGVSVFEEFLLGTDPTVADAPPQYPSPEDSDYMPLLLRIGAAGKLPDSLNPNCALCHNVTLRAGPYSRTCPRSSLDRGPAEIYSLLRFPRATNYALHVSANPYQAILPSSQTNGFTPTYTAKYTAQVWNGTNGVYPFITDTNQLLGVNLPLIREVYPKTATLYVPDMIIAADNDRDGVVNFASRTDRTYPTNPFTFWINEDSDIGSDDAASDADPSANTIDSSLAKPTSLRDLEDFARLQFKIEGLPAQFVNNPNLLTKIYLTNLSGTPSLRLFPVTASAGGLEYLTNFTTASLQILQNAFGVISSSAPLNLPNGSWLNAGSNAFYIPMIFEGITTGRCVITFGLASNTGPALALSRPFYLDLKPVTQFYEHWTVGDNTTTDWTQIPAVATRTADSAVFGLPKSRDDLDCILFVHGWRMQPWERRAFASTAFKRMWQLGYKGRFGLYSWPTDWTETAWWDMSLAVNRQNYDRSEERGWWSSLGLWNLLKDLNKQYPERLRLISHSMGGIVSSEALRYRGRQAAKPPLVQAYIASQAASVAHAYDATNPAVLSGTPVYGFYPRGTNNQPYYTGMKNAVHKDNLGAAQTYNFHNSVDYALTDPQVWPLNQSTKPDFGWTFTISDTGIFTWKRLGLYNAAVLHPKTDAYEIFAHIAPASSKALGAAEDPTHHIQSEIIGAVNLTTPPFSFTSARNDHSGQFNSINMNRRLYWWQVLSTFSLTNNLPRP